MAELYKPAGFSSEVGLEAKEKPNPREIEPRPSNFTSDD
jgi:hypothetical protein